ncbi:exportin-5-like [Teleopsis dalmanni]|uniref:exportin-5-like n=1 Tax=Teleopsis dalmanni TaxID=139649 RepID=UPI0018CCAFF5|nr:exportin-5-like [Teleopsis dalmanni]XP_037930373.1 exportin-5-like [Teleopsis dalmanni]XP_037931694.1 exportin-5-like [Teleopsis dalmanni]
MTQHSSTTALAEELAKAVDLIMHPQTTQQARMEAYIACERFKEESPLCAEVGLYLASAPHFGQNVKHFGLQLMEYTIKLKWNCIAHEEKIFIKENAMKLLLLGVGPAEDASLAHLKDALSRIIVEMIKREWPQQWTSLLSELSEACTKGECQTELVLLVFLRLVEDVAILQTIESNQRRKDMYQALTNNMNDIFEFFLRLVELHVTAFREATTHTNYQRAKAHSRVVDMVLLTVTGFVEWVSISHITCSNGKLLQILCILLNDKAFQCNSAECLSQITNRKGQLKERKPLLMLFGEELMRYIFSASQVLPDLTVPTSFEQNHIFLKKIITVLNGMAQQLYVLWGKEEGTMHRPPHFEIFLECILSLTRHPSLTITHGACLIWNILIKHDAIAKDNVINIYVQKLIEVIAPKIIKTSYPNSRTIPLNISTAAYICLEFDSEEEFAIFYHRCRADILELFRQTTLIQPLITFACCEQWLNVRLSKAHTETGNESCSVQDPIYLEWEALVSVIDSVVSRILMVSERPSVQSGLQLLEQCLKIETNNPLILSVLLSCISALFVFLSMSACQISSNNVVAMSGVSLLPRVLDKIFTALVYNDKHIYAKENSNRLQACKNLRRHAASLMVKLGHKYPLLLLPVFDQINLHVKTIVQQPQHQISKMERITLQEALILISNHFCDYERQSAFIGDILKDVLHRWTTFSNVFKSAFDFMNYVGLNKAPVYPFESDPNCANRGNIIEALYIVLGVIKRCSWPDDPDRASRGGFVVGFTELGNPIYRNPASPYIIPLLPHILPLLRILNELFRREALETLSDGYKNIHTMLEHEKKNLMGVCSVPTDPLDPAIKKQHTPFDKMQHFMTLIYEGCYHMLGSTGPSLGRDLYQLQCIAEALISSVFACLEEVPDHRLRPIIRVFFKPFVYSCPPAFYDTVLLPLFVHITPLMCDRLMTRWCYITSLYESGQLSEELNDSQEVLEDMLNRTLTREYLDILKIALVGGQISADNVACATIDVMDHDEHSMDGVTHSRATQSALLSDIISDLGAKLLKNTITSNYILRTLLSALSWNDGICSKKAVNILAPVMRFLAAEQLIDVNKAASAFTAVLQGLQIHGQHETNQAGLITLGVQFYELLRPRFCVLTEILQYVPSVNIADIRKFEEKMSVASVKGNKVDKTKKDLFKKITTHLVGRSINQLFRHEIQISNLPPMQSQNIKHSIDLIETHQNLGLPNLFHTSK